MLSNEPLLMHKTTSPDLHSAVSCSMISSTLSHDVAATPRSPRSAMSFSDEKNSSTGPVAL